MRPFAAPDALTAAVFLALAVGACEQADARRADAGQIDAARPSETTERATPAQRSQDAASVDLGFTQGEPDAPIAVVEFSDFGCPFCARFARTTLPVLQQEYIARGTVRWRYVPVVFGFPGGELMGSAAVCAAELAGDDVFWQVHDLLYTRQQVLRSEDARPRLLDWLAELGLDRDALDTCIDAPATAQTLRVHTETAVQWYVRGTPTFVVNGVPMAGAVPASFFRRVFETVLDPSGL